METTQSTEFPKTALKRAFKSETNKQVGRGAVEELENELQYYAEAVSEKAKELAVQDGRETVQARDIKEAFKKTEGSY